jgi:hypothetical protein
MYGIKIVDGLSANSFPEAAVNQLRPLSQPRSRVEIPCSMSLGFGTL